MDKPYTLVDLGRELGINITTLECWVNPLALAIRHEFDRHEDNLRAGEDGNYRKRALHRCISKKLPFNSEGNSMPELGRMVIPTVVCPACQSEVKMDSASGGAGGSYGFSFTCSCGCSVGLRFPENGISVNFNKK